MDQTNRFNDEIINTTSLKYIADGISKSINRKLTKMEAQDLLNYTRRHATLNWNLKSTTDIKNTIVNNYLYSRFSEEGRKKTQSSTELIDIHEIIKAHIGTTDQEPDYAVITNVDENGVQIKAGASGEEGEISSTTLQKIESVNIINKVSAVTTVGNITNILGKGDDASFQLLVNPQASYRSNYIILDSRNRDTSSDTGAGITSFHWTLINNSSTSSGSVISIGDIQQVIKIKSPNIRIPYTQNTSISAYKRVTLLFSELSGQAYIGQEGRKFHFIYSTELDGNMLECQAWLGTIS